MFEPISVGRKNDQLDECCPECGGAWKAPDPRPCTCRVTFIAIPPGQHIHLDCPQHGRVRIDGPNITL